MKGARWEFFTHSDKQGGPVSELAEVSGRIMDDKQALAFSRALAKRLKKSIGRQFVTAARRNPTLVHHGFAQGAGFHLLTQAGAPLADLYVYRSLAEPIAREFAKLMGIPVLLAPNDWAGEHGVKDPGHKSPLHAGTETIYAPGDPNDLLTRRNPSGKPVVGETWHTTRGGRCKVIAVRGGRVTILHMETGNRETIDLAEFLASYRFGGRTAVNPRRGPVAGSYWQRITYPQHIARVASVERASGGAPPMVNLEVVTGRGAVMGVSRIPQNELLASYEPLAQSSPYRKTLPNPYDGLGNGYSVGSVLIGTGLQNAGRAYTVLAIGKTAGRVHLEEHLTGRKFWTFDRHYRVDMNSNPRSRRKSKRANPRIVVGDRVKYSVAWLRSTGTYSGALPHARGVVTAILPKFGRDGLATISWDREGVPEKVLVANLVKAGAIERNPSRAKRAHRQIRHELGARVARASARAVRRPARPGNAAQALYYLQHHQARSARRKAWIPNPTTLLQAVAMVLEAAHWPGLAKDVRSGKMPPEPALELAHRSSNSMVQRSNLMKALRLVRRLAPKPNPRPSNELDRAKKTFRKWHEFDATKAKRMKGPGRTIPRTLVKLGDLVSVVYESDKYTGKRELYEHKTKRPHPVLATDPDGRNVHIIGGKMKVTADGLVN